jgi:class 3 adenylate cyclase
LSILDEIRTDAKATAQTPWTSRDGRVVPELEKIGLGNDRVELDAVFLYADLADSTELAINTQEIAAEVCKAYITGVTKLIRHNSGEVRSFDGDRVMGVFIGATKDVDAVRCGLQINTFFRDVLTPEFNAIYAHRHLTLSQTVGIDRSSVHVCRAGPKLNNDLIWVGRAPNIAAKLSGIRNGYPMIVTSDVFLNMDKTVWYDKNDGSMVWHLLSVNEMNGYGVAPIYGTQAWWNFGT